MEGGRGRTAPAAIVAAVVAATEGTVVQRVGGAGTPPLAEPQSGRMPEMTEEAAVKATGAARRTRGGGGSVAKASKGEDNVRGRSSDRTTPKTRKRNKREKEGRKEKKRRKEGRGEKDRRKEENTIKTNANGAG